MRVRDSCCGQGISNSRHVPSSQLQQFGIIFWTRSYWDGLMIKGIYVPPFIGDGQDSHLFTEFLLHFDFLFGIITEQVFYYAIYCPSTYGRNKHRKAEPFWKNISKNFCLSHFTGDLKQISEFPCFGHKKSRIRRSCSCSTNLANVCQEEFLCCCS